MFHAAILGVILSASAPPCPSPAANAYAPCDRKATRQVRALLNYIKQQQGSGFISGQTDYPDVQWIADNTGKKPAILALDFMRIPKRMGGQTDSTQVAIDWYKKFGGIVSYQWHWTSPTGAKNPDKGFYSGETTFDLASVLAHPDSADYRAMLEDIDDVAAEIKKLQAAGVPMIFRPLHEAQGRWFWWGTQGAEPCVKLYKLIFDRFTGKHRIHNLAWAWTVYPRSQNKGEPLDWYPGDDKVDFVVSDYCEKKSEYEELVNLTQGRKMVALAETMNAPDPERVLSETPWAYWVTWARRDWNSRSNDDMKRAMAHPKTITLDRLPKVSRW